MRIGLSVGDLAGIGPEIILKALSHPHPTGVHFTVFCDESILASQAEKLGIPLPSVEYRSVFGSTPSYEFGVPSCDAATIQLASFERALDEIDAGQLDAVVTAPWTKHLLGLIEYPPVGHTDVLGARYKCSPVMMLAGPRLRVVLVTTHIPISQVAQKLSSEVVLSTIEKTASELQKRFGVERPKIAVCGLNPHAGENGTMGREEIEVIIPALEQARTIVSDAQIEGPFPADTLFPSFSDSTPYDAVVAMYHDQGLVPLKTLHFGESVNITLGLPIIRTSVDHGSAYDIAGQGIASERSMRAAIDAATQLVERQKAF